MKYMFVLFLTILSTNSRAEMILSDQSTEKESVLVLKENNVSVSKKTQSEKAKLSSALCPNKTKIVVKKNAKRVQVFGSRSRKTKTVQNKPKPIEIVIRQKKETPTPVAPVVISPTPQPITINNNNVNNNYITPQQVQKEEPQKKSQLIYEQPRLHYDYRDDNHLSLYAHGGFLTRFRNFTGEIEFRGKKLGLGIYAQRVSIYNPAQDCILLTGNEIGLDLHYHFISYWFTRYYKKVEPGLYAQVGYGRFHYEGDNISFSGTTAGAGFDLALRVSEGTNLFARAGVTYIKDSSQWLYTGEQASVGVRFDLD